MRTITITAALLALASCDTIRDFAPQTAAGFDANGIIGAIDGASGAILAKCKTLDGEVVRVAIDDLAVETDGMTLVEAVRARRERACRIAGAVRVFVDDPVGEAPTEVALDGDVGMTGQNVQRTVDQTLLAQ